MTNHQFYTLWGEAITSPDRDAFVSDAAPLVPLGRGRRRPMAHVPELEKLWDAAHTGVKAIREFAGMTQAEFAARHLVPLRTLQRWEKASAPSTSACFFSSQKGCTSVEPPHRLDGHLYCMR